MRSSAATGALGTKGSCVTASPPPRLVESRPSTVDPPTHNAQLLFQPYGLPLPKVGSPVSGRPDMHSGSLIFVAHLNPIPNLHWATAFGVLGLCVGREASAASGRGSG
eukprot:366227-Chlamydomonas_euryale.AAC.19